ncbi:MAG TPA: hypothetical protein VKA83_25880 [Methylomirabilota bacterium]|nr:hypothetical protein [Methylomirabilota bacterium]
MTLKHPDGKTVKCGPYAAYMWGQHGAAAERERGCIEDFKAQGYQRQP